MNSSASKQPQYLNKLCLIYCYYMHRTQVKLKKNTLIPFYNNKNKKRQKHVSFFHILKKNTSKIVSAL